MNLLDDNWKNSLKINSLFSIVCYSLLNLPLPLIHLWPRSLLVARTRLEILRLDVNIELIKMAPKKHQNNVKFHSTYNCYSFSMIFQLYTISFSEMCCFLMRLWSTFGLNSTLTNFDKLRKEVCLLNIPPENSVTYLKISKSHQFPEYFVPHAAFLLDCF